MNNPQLSIITPVYNGQQYLTSFLQAVIDQNCSVMEHIVVDGGSSDGSVQVIKSFAQRYPHIRWISEKDKGVGDALNKGVAMARGKYMGVIALDDRYQPNALNQAVKLLFSLPELAFLVGNCNEWNEKGEFVRTIKPKGLSPLRILWGRPYPNPAAYFYHRSLHQKIGLYGIEEPIDLEFLLKVYSLANVHYVDKLFGDFRMTHDSITLRSDQDGTQDENVKKVVERYLQTLPIGERLFYTIVVRVKYLSRVLWYYFRRITHYLQNPKDIKRILAKVLKSS